MPVFDEIGRFVGYRGVGRHITERKRAEAEHRAHLWFLESMDRINRAMQGTHDLRADAERRRFCDARHLRLRPRVVDLPVRSRCSFLARRHGAHAAAVSGRLRLASRASGRRSTLQRLSRRRARPPVRCCSVLTTT